MDNEALAGERGVPDDGQIAARRARAPTKSSQPGCMRSLV